MIVGKTEKLGVEITINGTKDLDCLKELDIAVIDKLFLHIYKPISLFR